MRGFFYTKTNCQSTPWLRLAFRKNKNSKELFLLLVDDGEIPLEDLAANNRENKQRAVNEDKFAEVQSEFTQRAEDKDEIPARDGNGAGSEGDAVEKMQLPFFVHMRKVEGNFGEAWRDVDIEKYTV